MAPPDPDPDPDRPPLAGRIGYTEGVFDLFHIGHLDLLRAAGQRCERLVVGVLDDDLAAVVAGRRPYMHADERRSVVEAVRWVSAVVAVTDDDLAAVHRRTRFDVVFRHGGPLAATRARLDAHPVGAAVGYAVADLPPARQSSSNVLRTALAAHLAETAEL